MLAYSFFTLSRLVSLSTIASFVVQISETLLIQMIHVRVHVMYANFLCMAKCMQATNPRINDVIVIRSLPFKSRTLGLFHPL